MGGWRWCHIGVRVIVEAHLDERVLPVDLQVLPQGGWVGVRLVAPSHPAGEGLLRGVHVHVLLSVARVGKPAVATVDLALEGLLTCDK